MCGICGLLFSERVPSGEDRAVVDAMVERLRHRGPDGEGTEEGQGFVFGHTRLAIIDIEGGVQPMSTADGRYCLIYNGEIYNYLELRKDLQQRGSVFRTSSDTEVFLQVLAEEGPEAVSTLNGMFAFAFVDRHTGDWILGRDPFGIKPLYYVVAGDQLIFASEIKALLEHPRVEASLDWRAFQQYLTFQYCLHGATLFEGIKAVEPGTYVTGRGGRIERVVRYWDTDYKVNDRSGQPDYRDSLLTLLRDSARLQIRSDVPLGAYLSGGMDSAAISAMAAEHLGQRLPVFHGRFAEGPAYDESSFARALAESIGADYQEVVPTAQGFVDTLPELIWSLDEPVAGPGLFPQYRVTQMAAGQVKVVLGGQGGDEVFGGYARYLLGYLEQALKGAIFETQEEGDFVVTLSSIIPNLPILQQYKPLMQHFWRDGLFEAMDARYFRLVDRSPRAKMLLCPALRERFDQAEVFADFQRVFNHPDTISYVNKMTHFDQKTLLPALLQVEDRVSMACSIEARVPFLDVRIVDLITSMPPPLKFKGGRTKHVLRQAVEGLLPEAITSRKDKMGFPVPLNEWMEAGPVHDFVHDVLLGDSCRNRGVFDPAAVEEALHAPVPFDRTVWGLLCLELWFRRFFDSTGVE